MINLYLDQYQQAKHEYDEAGHKLEDGQRMVDNQEVTVLLLKQRVERYQEWENRRQRLLDWQTRLLPVKELYELIEKARDAREIRRKARAKVRENEERVRTQEEELIYLKALHAQKRENYDAAKRAFDNANEIPEAISKMTPEQNHNARELHEAEIVFNQIRIPEKICRSEWTNRSAAPTRRCKLVRPRPTTAMTTACTSRNP